MVHRTVPVWLLIVALTGCSRSNNLLLGRVETTVAGHKVVVTDCYRTSVPAPKRVEDEDIFAPCKDAEVRIRKDELLVNGKSYGKMGAGDAVIVDHGVVSVRRGD